MEDITLRTTVQQVLEKYPYAIEFFESKGMYCKTCKGKKHETLYNSAIYYGLDPEEFLNELRLFIRQNQKIRKV